MSMKGIVKKIDFAIHMFMRSKKNLKVPLPDGHVLRADAFTPLGKGPWPVILTTFPYQKDGVGGGLSLLEGYDLVKAGYAVVMADLRGHGASDGITRDPFDGLRVEDLSELVEWCGRQEWSNGKVGMKGESYGGMTALLAATGNPPSLKAIYDFMAPAFFYRNLVYPGGSLNMIGLCGAWLGFMNLTNLFPPFYIKGRPDWRTVWEKRLEAYTPYLVSTSDHITYDDYWKMNDFPVEKITIPTFILEGWWDFARNDGFQIYEKLNCPKKLLIGPWVHTFPSFSELEQMDYMRDMIRWFDYWLKDKDAGIMDEPPFSIYVMGAEQWKYESEWPPERAVEKTWYCHSDGTLGFEADRNENTVNYEHDPAVGTAAGLMIVFPLGLDYPQEQREDNMRSLAFDTAPVDEPVEIVGEPSVQLTVSTDMPDASITVKLCDVDRDGNSTLITSGSLRLSCRDGFEKPVPPEQGKAYTISIPLFHSCYRVCTGNRLRLCLSLSDFPRIFPLPYSGSVTLHFGEGKNQQLSVRALSGEDQPEIYPHFELPDLSILEGQEEPFSELCVQRDEENNRVTVHGAVAYEIPLFHMKKPLNLSYHYDASIVEGKPDTAVIETEGEADFLLDGRRFVCKTRQVVTQNEVEISSSIEEEGSIIFEREFQRELYWI